MSEQETTVAEITQVGYSCGHAIRSMTAAELRAGGYTHYRVIGYLDVGRPCPACAETRAAKRTARRAARR